MKTCILVLVMFAALTGAVRACDTWVALPDASRDALTILAKNSDRLVFDSGPLMFYPRRSWPAGSTIDLGRLSIPQAQETYATLGSSPYWCWGYEEGINEYSVAIGNEGIWTKVLTDELAAYNEGRGPDFGPTGMDLIRLGLERGKTAREALGVITALLETYGQFGTGLPATGMEGAYDNSYIIADPLEAWILETAGTKWVAKHVSQGTASVSNVLSIGAGWDIASSDLVDYAVTNGWWPADSAAEFDFSRAYIDDGPIHHDRNLRSAVRAQRSRELLRQNTGQIDVPYMMRIARDQGSEPSIDLDVTASSCVAVLSRVEDDIPVFWWCPTRPSNSCYVPFFVHGAGVPAIVSAAGTYGKKVVPPDKAERDEFSADSYWWMMRDLCDKTNADWDTRHPIVRAEFDTLERAFADGLGGVTFKASELRRQGKSGEAARLLADYTKTCLDQVIAKIGDLSKQFAAETVEVPEAFKPYTGSYMGNFGPFTGKEFKVLVQNGRLAVDIPGQAVVELKDPDAAGLRYLVITNTVAVAFDMDSTEQASALRFYQTTEMPRRAAPEAADTAQAREAAEGAEAGKAAPADIPDLLRPYIGAYTVPLRNIELKVVVQDGNLAVEIPEQGTIPLNEPDGQGWRTFVDDDQASVAFDQDQAGAVTKMKLRRVFAFPRKTVEAEIKQP